MVYLWTVALVLLLAPAAAAQADEPLRVGNGVSPPRLLSKIEPEYSEEARLAKLNGTVVLYVVVRPDGHASDMRVLRSLGLGLDEQAIAAVAQWRFQPGQREGSAVSVQATIEVNFRLLPNRGFEAGWHTQRVQFQTAEGVTRPTVRHAKFPPAGETSETGAVTVSCLVDEQGAPVALRVEKSTAAGLDSTALEIVRGWRFNPAMKDGKPIAVAATLVVAFGSPGAPSPRAAPATRL